jgi:hypothetical protein
MSVSGCGEGVRVDGSGCEWGRVSVSWCGRVRRFGRDNGGKQKSESRRGKVVSGSGYDRGMGSGEGNRCE